MSDALKNQVAVVTGASRGIGREVARRLAKEGMKVALVARSEGALKETAALIREEGGTAQPVPTDITDPRQVEAMIEATEQSLGPIDLLVNNAGALAAIGPLWENDPDDWWNDLTVNVLGVFLTCRAMLPRMIVRRIGRIVNFVGGGVGGPFPFVSAYATSKAAVMRLTENLAFELKETDSEVKVFAMSPGFIRTSMTEQFEKTDAGKEWMGFMAKRLEQGEDVPPTYAAELVARIASGDLDALAGRYLHASNDADELDSLPDQADEIVEQDLRTLRIRK